MKYKLTIALITMNRAKQLKLAIESCVAAKLPKKTQFVIVDNGSIDNTKDVVNSLKSIIDYDVVYHREPENRGVGTGRNICFDLSEGEYIFFLDDDAEIPEECQKIFFENSIIYLDEHPSVAILTTDVVDKVFGERKIVLSKTRKVDNLPCAYTFHEGTVFWRNCAFASPVFMDILFGSEHLSVSTVARDKGYDIVFDKNIYINHNPLVDKWKNKDSAKTAMQAISNTYVIKKIMYPVIFAPLLYLAYKKRVKNCQIDRQTVKQFSAQQKEVFEKNKNVSKVRVTTIINSFKEFGLTVF